MTAALVHPRLRNALGRIPSDVRWLGLIILTLLAAEAGAALIAPSYTYDRWDNFEYYTPMIAAAHRLLLSGELPIWNPHQHLGEGFITNPQMGTFYPPYTLAYLAVSSFALNLKWLSAIIGVSHAIAGGCGCFVLLRHFGARPSLAAAVALGMATSGYLRSVSAIWVFVGPTFAWLPWTLWGAARLLGGSRRLIDRGVFVAGLVAQASIGQPQIWVYVLLCVGLCSLGLCFSTGAPLRALIRRAGELLLHTLAALALGALTMLPVLMQSRHTARKVAVPFWDYVSSSASLQSLWGMLLPFYRVNHDFITEEQCSFMLHQGTWLVPAILVGVAIRLVTPHPDGADRALVRRALTFTLVGGLFLVFALGRNTPVYPLTYSIPMWSSFRWPHKFLIVALPCLGLAGGLWLELVARARAPSVYARAGAAIAMLVLAVLAGRIGWATITAQPLGRFGLAAAFVALLASAFVNVPFVRGVLVAASGASALVLIALAQSFTPLVLDQPHTIDVLSYGWSRAYRVLPVHRDERRVDITKRMLFTTATLVGVESVTGCTTAMAPHWYTDWLKSNYLGLLPPATYRELLPSHFLRSLNVKYVVAPAGDETVARWLKKGKLVRRRRLGSVEHYELPKPLPRVYFASEVHAFTPEAFRRGLWLNRADVRAVYAEGLTGGEFAGAGKVLRTDFLRPDRPVFEVESPSGGFVLVSVSYAPEWRAFIDGNEVRVLRSNGLLQGLQVPPGRHTVELRYDHPGFRWGLRSAAFGALLLGLIWTPWKPRPKRIGATRRAPAGLR